MIGDDDRLNQLMERVAVMEARHESVGQQLTKIEHTVEMIAERLERLGNRPSWGILVMITFLSSLCVALVSHFVR